MIYRSRLQVALELAVPCVFGLNGSHVVRVHVDKSHQVTVLTCECEQNPPSDEVRAVTTALLREGNNPVTMETCTEVVKSMRQQVKAGSSAFRPASGPDVPDMLISLVREASKEAYGKRSLRNFRAQWHNRERSQLLKEHLDAELLEALTSKIPAPRGWSVELQVRDIDKKGKQRPGLVCTVTWHGIKAVIGHYRGRGVFTLASEYELSRLIAALRCTDEVSPRHDRRYKKRESHPTLAGGDEKRPKYLCSVCRTRVQNVESHTKTSKHKDSVQNACLDILAHLGKSLSS